MNELFTSGPAKGPRLQDAVELLTVSPILRFQPAGPWDHTPSLGAVRLAVPLREGHGRKHVRHVVAVIAQFNLCTRLQTTERRLDSGLVVRVSTLKMRGRGFDSRPGSHQRL